LRGGLDGIVQTIAVGVGGLVYVGGYFSAADGLIVSDRVAVWNGSVWLPLEVDLPGATGVYRIEATTQTLTLGFLGTGTATTSGVVTVVNNSPVDVYPTVIFTGPGSVVELTNYTTGDVIYLNITLNAGETATLFLGPNPTLRMPQRPPGYGLPALAPALPFPSKGSPFATSYRSDIGPNILAGSNPARWRLAPGSNSISLYMTGTTAASAAALVWRDQYDTIYGSVK
jgi:hypothetical protein